MNILRHNLFYAIAAAVLFGTSTPLAKIFIGEVNPWVQAGLLYFGSGIGILILLFGKKFILRSEKTESIFNKDLKWLLGATFFGGILGPVSLMYGLSMVSASVSSLMLNLEAVMTSVIAWTVFKEHFDKRIVLGMIVIVLGNAILYWPTDDVSFSLLGLVLVSAACVCWAIDNNFTRLVSAQDPLKITAFKSLVAGSINLGLAAYTQTEFPGIQTGLLVGLIGFFGYGVSIMCFVLSLRHIGTSRTGAFFSTAPFVGALMAIAIFREPITWNFAIAFILMGYGVWIHITEDHVHEHEHEELEHEHMHYHDEHHQHDHPEGIVVSEPHSHFHRHKKLRHSHKHFPDIHHRHSH